MIVMRALSGFGVGPAQRKRALNNALRARRLPRASGRALRRTEALSALVAHWANDRGYVEVGGRARTLAISGDEPSFESLARRFMPDVSLEEALALAHRYAEVTIRPGSKIALTGSLLINLSRSATTSLASAVRHADYIFNTVRENLRRSNEVSTTKKLERSLTVAIPKARYDDAVRRLRPLLSDLFEQTLAVLMRDSQHRPSNDSTVLILGAYLARQDDFDRTGYPKPPAADGVSPPSRKRR